MVQPCILCEGSSHPRQRPRLLQTSSIALLLGAHSAAGSGVVEHGRPLLAEHGYSELRLSGLQQPSVQAATPLWSTTHTCFLAKSRLPCGQPISPVFPSPPNPLGLTCHLACFLPVLSVIISRKQSFHEHWRSKINYGLITYLPPT